MKSSLASATSVLALLAFESAKFVAPTVVLGVAETTLLGIGRAEASTITYNPTTITIIDLVNEATASTKTDTVTGTNSSGSGTRTLSVGAVSTPAGSPGTFTGTTASTTIGSGATKSVTTTYTYTAASIGSTTATVVSTLTNSTASGNATATLTLVGSGVAPIANVALSNNGSTAAGASTSTGNIGYVLIGNTATATLTVSNSGNGNLSKLGTVSNLRGTLGSPSSSVFSSGSGASFSLSDAGAATSTVSTTYTFTPTTRGATTATVATTFNDGIGVTNRAGTIASTLTGTGVAPAINVGSTASAGYVLVGQTQSAALTVSNTGDGNLSKLGTVSNLRGTVGSTTSSNFSGSGGSVSLIDSGSSTYNYVYAPTTMGASSTTVVSSFVNGGTANAAGTTTTTLVGMGVAPINAVSSTAGTSLVRLGTSTTATVSVNNVGNGNLSGLGTISNLRGGITTSVGSGFTASGSNPASISLTDSGTSTLNWTYAPASRTLSTTTATFSFVNGNTGGTNAAQTVTASVAAQGVGPQFQSTYNASINTPTAVSKGATAAPSATVAFGSVAVGKTTVYLALQNITTDSNGGNSSLTDLTIESFALSGTNASKFSVALSSPVTVSKGGTFYLPISVMDTSAGFLTANLTLFTDQTAALGGIGDTFTYQLTALVPEPASMVVMGAGLAGLAFMRRRRAKTPA